MVSPNSNYGKETKDTPAIRLEGYTVGRPTLGKLTMRATLIPEPLLWEKGNLIHNQMSSPYICSRQFLTLSCH